MNAFLGFLRAALAYASLSLIVTPSAFAQEFTIDHFKVYDVKDMPVEAEVRLKGQFDEDFVPARVRRLTHFATPVSKNGEGLRDPSAHLTWYSIAEDAATEPRSVIVENQFGEGLITIGRPLFLLAPAEKQEEGSGRPQNLSHFKCYAVQGGVPVDVVVSLKDQFGVEELVKVLQPILFAVPVAKLHDERREEIKNEEVHLTVYAVAPSDRTATDQFAERRDLRFHPCRWLCVPSKKRDCEIPHFKVYRLEETPHEEAVQLRGQFDPGFLDARLTRLTHFATPVSKNGEGIPDRHAHLSWYELKGPTEAERPIEIKNQFGTSEIRLGQPRYLLAPSEKIEEGSQFPRRLDHFKVYEVLAGRPPGRVVSLEDQFGRDNAVVVLEPRLFCVPVQKIHNNEPTPIFCPAQHLTVYDIAPRPRSVIDQFGSRQLEFESCEMLCVPTRKRVLEPRIGLDHFEIYKIEDQPHGLTDNRVDLVGPFDSGHAFVASLSHFAVVVQKNEEPIRNRHAHFNVYSLDDAGEQVPRRIEFENQFGPQSARIGRRAHLLVPAEKIEPGSAFPTQLDHYVAYEVVEAATPGATALLKDQFPLDTGDDDVREIRELKLFAVPVRKTHAGTPSAEVHSPDEHLAIYVIDQRKVRQERRSRDQFGFHSIVTQQSDLLAVPSRTFNVMPE